MKNVTASTFLFLMGAGSISGNNFAFLKQVNGNSQNAFSMQESTFYSATMNLMAVYIIDEFNYKAMVFNNALDIILLEINVTNSLITYKKVLTNVEPIKYVRQGRFFGPNDILFGGTGRKIMTSLTSNEYLYITNYAN
jgi:hypothetical protein